MSESEYKNSQHPCTVCGESRVILRDGFLYCIECGTRAADSQPMLDFTEDVYVGNRAARKQKTKNVDQNYGNIWSTWHGYNMILAGLTNELGLCCSKEYELKKTALKLWGLLLKINQVAFYTKASKPSPPRLMYKFHKKDLEYLYNMKKPKKKKAIKTEQLDETLDPDELNKIVKKKKQLLFSQHFEKIQSSQQTNIASQTLADLKVSEEVKSTVIKFTRSSKKYYKKYMTIKKLKEHAEGGYCGFDCKCLLKRKNKVLFQERVNFLSVYNLYVILALSLRINNDDVHIGDLLRWCREGHISLGRYNHFFPEDMVFKSKDPHFIITANAVNHYSIRKTAGIFAKTFNFTSIRSPNIKFLVKRYCKELELPEDLLKFALKLIEINGPLPDYEPTKSSILPNYEAIAMSYIIVALKMIFGLDGVTENKMSASINKINSVLSLDKKVKNVDFNYSMEYLDNGDLKRLFEWKSWAKYIEYRKICIGQYHYPTKIRLDPEDCDDPDLFLHHKNIIRRDEDVEYVTKNQTISLIKTMVEDVNYNYNDIEKSYPVFPCSICPMSSYVEHLLLWSSSDNSTYNKELLEEDFTSYGLSFIFNAKLLKDLLSERNVLLQSKCRREAVTNIKSKNFFLRHINKLVTTKSNQDVTVIDCSQSKWKENQISDKITSLLLDLDQSVIKKPFIIEINMKNNTVESNDNRERIELNMCYEDYWIQHYTKLDKFSKLEFEEELNSYFSSSFSWLLKECASTIEMSAFELYKELCNIESKLIKMKTA